MTQPGVQRREPKASSTSLDAQEKVASYRRAGVREYVVWRTEDGAVDWWVLEEDEYRRLPASKDGVLRSRVFAGLWLDAKAMLARDGARVLASLQQGLQTPEHKQFVEELAKQSPAIEKP